MDNKESKYMTFEQFSDFIAENFASSATAKLPDLYKLYLFGCRVQRKRMALKINISIDFLDGSEND